MYKENYYESLRKELVEIVSSRLTPIALRYKYASVPLESHIKWKPIVLVIGNYSSGKSTLINEVLGVEAQKTGQAPTDDSFTVLTSAPDNQQVPVEQRDGHVLLNDDTYPFEDLKRHGQRFSSHFTLKTVKSPLLDHLSIIDTPGMLDSMSENDRGYPYQEVIGDLASRADLVLVLFDPHKAGTVRESHASLRETLPRSTFEDRVLFVLNRIDECTNMTDLLRVYGTLCWNLSQMTGRKDIPMIHLTYSEQCSSNEVDQGHLQFFSNQRDELKKAISAAPRHRLDHLASFTETHAERLLHLLEGVMSFKKAILYRYIKFFLGVFLAVVLCFISVIFKVKWLDFSDFLDRPVSYQSLTVLFLIVCAAFVSYFVIKTLLKETIKKDIIRKLDDLTSLETISRQDSWGHVRSTIEKLILSDRTLSFKDCRKDISSLRQIITTDSKEIRAGINEYTSVEK